MNVHKKEQVVKNLKQNSMSTAVLLSTLGTFICIIYSVASIDGNFSAETRFNKYRNLTEKWIKKTLNILLKMFFSISLDLFCIICQRFSVDFSASFHKTGFSAKILINRNRIYYAYTHILCAQW